MRWLLAFYLVLILSPAQAQLGGSFVQGAVPVAPSCDAICTLLGTGVSGHIWKLTSSGHGNIANQVLPRTCANFDGAAQVGGTPCTGVGASLFANDAAVANDPGFGGADPTGTLTGYSVGGIQNTNGLVAWIGGGHGGMDGTVYVFDSEAAAATYPTGGHWAIGFKGPQYYYSGAASPPSWSGQSWPDGTGCTAGWNWALNADGQQAAGSPHSGFGTVALGNNKFIINGYAFGDGANNGNFCYAAGANGEVVDVIAHTATVYKAGFPRDGGTAVSRCDGLLYTAGTGASTFSRLTNLQSGTGWTVTNLASGGSGGVAYVRDLVFLDPEHPTQCDYVGFSTTNGLTGPFGICIQTNIGVTNGNVCGGFATITPTFQAGEYYSSFYDPDDNIIYWFDGTGHLYPVNFHGSSNPNNWTVDADTRTLSGDTMALYDTNQPANHFNVCEWLPANRIGGGGIPGVICIGYMEVYLVRP